MKRMIVILALLLAGCGGSDRPGDPAVYERIAGLSDCSQLQEQFNLAERTHQRGGEWGPSGTAYMEAADKRMREVGCYGS